MKKKVLFLSCFVLLLVSIGFSFNNSVGGEPEPKVKVIDFKSYVTVDCDKDGVDEFTCECGKDCDACTAGAKAWLKAGGCSK